VPNTEKLAGRLLHAMQSINQVIKINPDSVIGTLNVNQVRMLVQIRNQPGIAQKDIAERLSLSPASVSIAIRQMEEVELIQRRPDDEDGRIMRLYLDKEGTAIVKESESQQIAILSELLSALSAEHQKLLIDLLDEALGNLDGYLPAEVCGQPKNDSK